MAQQPGLIDQLLIDRLLVGWLLIDRCLGQGVGRVVQRAQRDWGKLLRSVSADAFAVSPGRKGLSCWLGTARLNDVFSVPFECS